MNFTLSKHAKDVMKNRNILKNWVYDVVLKPSVYIKVQKDEIHMYGIVAEYNERCLKVVVNPIKEIIITTYFDRKMKKRGCK